MQREGLLFYQAYENFYTAAENSETFREFCREAYGMDLSQDGFSDIAQVERILRHAPCGKDAHILDIGCGNGKLLRYLQEKTGANIQGFDYSSNAVESAEKMGLAGADFRVGIIGETEYPAEAFDLIVSMDTMYFAKDMTAFAAQIKRWLKPSGVLFAAYQEGDIMPRTENCDTTVIAQALRANEMCWTVEDITCETYDMLRRKRVAAEKYRQRFADEDRLWLYELLIGQTECAMVPLEEYRRSSARYIYAAGKIHK